MSGLRALALSYLVSAAVFVLAVTYAAHPDFGGALTVGTQEIGAVLDRQLWQPALQTARRADSAFRDRVNDISANGRNDFGAVTIAIAPPGPNDVRTLAQPRALNIAPRSLTGMPPAGRAGDRFSDPDFSASATVTILPDLAPPRAATCQNSSPPRM